MSKPYNAKPGCFSGILHVLLCDTDENGNSPPPLHSPDHITESHVTEKVNPIKGAIAMVNDDASATPGGVIARLMGLDSLPNNNTNLVSKSTINESVPRSKSLNFVDYMLNFDTSRVSNHHRRAKTSASFREVPELLHQQKKNRDLVLLYSDSGGRSKDQQVGSKLRKQEMLSGESRHRKKKGNKNNKDVVREKVTVLKERNQAKNKKISNLKNEPRLVPVKNSSSTVRRGKDAEVLASASASSKKCSCRKSGPGSRSGSRLQNKQKAVISEPKQVKNVRKQRLQKKIETEFSSEDLSPVSVLDINDYTYLYGPDFLDYTSPLVSESKWESSELLILRDGFEDRARSKNKGYAYPDINREREFLSLLELKLRTLTENDMRESDSTQKRMCETEGFEEVCVVYERKIFDILLNEVVNELVELSC